MNEINTQRLHSRPNVSTLRSSVFIRGDLMLKLMTLYTAVIARKYIWVKQNVSSKSALAEHVCETSHNIALEDSRISTTNNRYGQRLCLEAWHTNASSCALNRDDGIYLPQEYLHLVGR